MCKHQSLASFCASDPESMQSSPHRSPHAHPLETVQGSQALRCFCGMSATGRLSTFGSGPQPCRASSFGSNLQACGRSTFAWQSCLQDGARGRARVWTGAPGAAQNVAALELCALAALPRHEDREMLHSTERHSAVHYFCQNCQFRLAAGFNSAGDAEIKRCSYRIDWAVNPDYKIAGMLR